MYLVKQEFQHRGETHKGYAFYSDETYIKFMDMFSRVWNNRQSIRLNYEITDYDYVDIYFDRSTYLKSVDAILLTEDTYNLLAQYMPAHSGTTFVGALHDAVLDGLVYDTPRVDEDAQS